MRGLLDGGAESHFASPEKSFAQRKMYELGLCKARYVRIICCINKLCLCRLQRLTRWNLFFFAFASKRVQKRKFWVMLENFLSPFLVTANDWRHICKTPSIESHSELSARSHRILSRFSGRKLCCAPLCCDNVVYSRNNKFVCLWIFSEAMQCTEM